MRTKYIVFLVAYLCVSSLAVCSESLVSFSKVRTVYLKSGGLYIEALAKNNYVKKLFIRGKSCKDGKVLIYSSDIRVTFEVYNSDLDKYTHVEDGVIGHSEKPIWYTLLPKEEKKIRIFYPRVLNSKEAWMKNTKSTKVYFRVFDGSGKLLVTPLVYHGRLKGMEGNGESNTQP